MKRDIINALNQAGFAPVRRAEQFATAARESESGAVLLPNMDFMGQPLTDLQKACSNLGKKNPEITVSFNTKIPKTKGSIRSPVLQKLYSKTAEQYHAITGAKEVTVSGYRDLQLFGQENCKDPVLTIIFGHALIGLGNDGSIDVPDNHLVFTQANTPFDIRGVGHTIIATTPQTLRSMRP